MRCSASIMVVWACISTVACAAPGPEVIDPEVARQDPDFRLQGEYVGTGTWKGKQAIFGGQVIALGNHNFRAVVYPGGLPGGGWKRGNDRIFLEGASAEAVVKLANKDSFSARIAANELTIKDSGGETVAKLARTGRKSSTLGAKPPQAAVVLFDGTNVSHFPGATLTKLKTLEAGCNLKGKYKIARFHLEFRLSWKPTARGQGRSNSGVYLGGIPEIQVLDSFGLEGANNECGGFYGRRPPDVNMCFPPLTWQTYDVVFSKPKTTADGKPNDRILVSVRHNNVVVHQDYRTNAKESPLRGLHLQRHGNRVQYRNIWLVEP